MRTTFTRFDFLASEFSVLFYGEKCIIVYKKAFMNCLGTG
jgi:hypothetical protein